MPVDSGAHGVFEAVAQTRNPRGTIAYFGRATFAGRVALAATRFYDLPACARGRRASGIGRLDPVAARLIHHVHDRALQLDIAQIETRPVRGHVTHALQRALIQRRKPPRRARLPGLLVSDPWRPLCARAMTLRADLVHDLLAGPCRLRVRCLA